MNGKDMIQVVQPLSVNGKLQGKITGISFDSRDLAPGELFVAVRGGSADGHDFIPQAVKKGISYVVCERDPLPAAGLRPVVLKI